MDIQKEKLSWTEGRENVNNWTAQRKVWTKTEKKLNEGHRERNGLAEKDVKCWTADRKVVTNGLQADRKSDMDCGRRGSQIWTSDK
jgi:hypothetical protein